MSNKNSATAIIISAITCILQEAMVTMLNSWKVLSVYPLASEGGSVLLVNWCLNDAQLVLRSPVVCLEKYLSHHYTTSSLKRLYKVGRIRTFRAVNAKF